MKNNFNYMGHLGDVVDPKAFYSEENYVIAKGVIPFEKIDSLVRYYNQTIVPSNRIYYRQDGTWGKNRLSQVLAVENPFLYPHCWEENEEDSRFSDEILALLADKNFQKALQEVTGVENHYLLQSMFFDQSFTAPHQDWIFLDSRPNGNLIAAWIALEDIYEDSTRFFVMPGSHHFKPSVTYGSKTGIYDHFSKEMNRVVNSKNYSTYAPTLKKGDVFFWGSRLIHGSLEAENKARRRQSLATHFVPVGMKAGNLEADLDVTFKTKHGLQYAYHPLDFRRNKLLNEPPPPLPSFKRKAFNKVKGWLSL